FNDGDLLPEHPRIKDFEGYWSTDDVFTPCASYLKKNNGAAEAAAPQGWTVERHSFAGRLPRRPERPEENCQVLNDSGEWSIPDNELLSWARWDKVDWWDP